MNKSNQVAAALLLLLTALTLPAWAEEMHGGKYSIKSTVVSGGGTTMSSGPYQMSGTLGQPTPLAGDELPSSGSHQLKPGFWPTVADSKSCTADFLGDGDVDGLDLFLLAGDSDYVLPLAEFAGQFGTLCE